MNKQHGFKTKVATWMGDKYVVTDTGTSHVWSSWDGDK